MRRFFSVVISWFRLRDPFILNFDLGKLPHDQSFWKRSDIRGPVLVYVSMVSAPIVVIDHSGALIDMKLGACPCLYVDVPILDGRIIYRFTISHGNENDTSFSHMKNKDAYDHAICIRDIIHAINPDLSIVMIWNNGKFPNKPPA